MQVDGSTMLYKVEFIIITIVAYSEK